MKWKMDMASMASQGWRVSGGVTDKLREKKNMRSIRTQKGFKKLAVKKGLKSYVFCILGSVVLFYPLSSFPHCLQSLRKSLKHSDIIRDSVHTKDTGF